MTINRPLFRCATFVHTRLEKNLAQRPRAALPTHAWDACLQLSAQVNRAELYGWHLAARRVETDLLQSLAQLVPELSSVHAQRIAAQHASEILPVLDIYQDLVALQEELEEFGFDLQQQWITVTTEPITLEEVSLGSFEIRLDLTRLSGDRPYRIIAKEPNSPPGRDNVTHPHVMDEHLCEGHSRQAIRTALLQGRLLDFFLLIANGLRSYNDESPFVALDLWHGESCSDCGCGVDEDDRFVCQGCQDTICADCESCCNHCETSLCSQCGVCCSDCENVYCRTCLKPCHECRQRTCGDCLQDDERCNNCHENDEEEPQETIEEESPVQSVCLGQAALPA